MSEIISVGERFGPFEREARPVRVVFLIKKDTEGYTQEKLAAELEVTQGVVGRWLNGHKRIPDDKLLKMAVLLGFDPLASRPQIRDFVDLANRALTGAERENLISPLEGLSDSEKEQLLNYRNFLLSQRQS